VPGGGGDKSPQIHIKYFRGAKPPLTY